MVWSEETPSRGQCAPSSICLLADLSRDFPELELRLAVGKVIDLRAGKDAIELHVWVCLYEDGLFRAPVVIDLTADQAERIGDRVVFAPHQELIDGRGLAYTPFSTPTLGEEKPATLARAELLRSRMAA